MTQSTLGRGKPPAYGLGRFPLDPDPPPTCQAPCCRRPPAARVAWLYYGEIYTASLCPDCTTLADLPTNGVDAGGPLA